MSKDEAVKTLVSFEPVDGAVDITVAPLADDGEVATKVGVMQFGHEIKMKGAEETGRAGRYVFTYPHVAFGREVEIVGKSPDPMKAVAQAIATAFPNLFTIEDFDVTCDAGFEDDFFKQKYVAPKVDKADVWTNPEFENDRDELNAMRGEVETALEAAQAAEGVTDENRLAVSQLILSAYNKLGRDRAALKAWAKGGKDGSNMPLITQLGKGANSLTEAMLLAEMSDMERLVKPATLTSGKAIAAHKLKAIVQVLSEKNITTDKDFKLNLTVAGGDKFLDEHGLAFLIRKIANVVYGVAKPDEMSLGEVIEAVNASAQAMSVEFSQKYGKNVSTYVKEEYTAALYVFGAVHLSDHGSELLKDVATLAEKVGTARAEGEDALKAVSESVKKAFGSRGNALLYQWLKAYTAHVTATEVENRNREIMKEVNETSPVDEKTAKSFGKLDVMPAAAHVFKLICTHKDAVEIKKALDKLWTQYADTELKVDEPETETEE